MKINLTKKQYRELVRAVHLADYLIGPMSDFVSDKYKKETEELQELNEYLLQYAKDFDCNDILEKECCDRLHTSEEYNDNVLDTIFEYDDYVLFENLSKKLAKRDFCERYTEKEVEKMSEERRGYLGVPLYPFEKKYYDEFNENEYNRLIVVDDSDKKLFNWNNIKNRLRKSVHKIYFYEREIRWCSLGENVGFEQNGKGEEFTRPVVILKRLSLDTCLILPLTTSKNRKNTFSLGFLKGSDEESFVMVEQIRLVDGRRLGIRIDLISKDIFADLVKFTSRVILGS